MLQFSSTTGQRQRKEKLDVSQTSPGQRFPQGPDVSVPDFYKEVPAIPRRRQEVCAGADRPAEHFFFSTGRGAFSFWRNQKGPPPRPARWGKEEQGSGRSFRRRRKRSLADFATTQWGAHPCGNNPLAGARPPRPPNGGPRLSEGTPFTSPFPPESGAPYSKRRIPSSEIALLICDTASSSRTVPHS